jgi:hypothetical protein
VNDNKQVESSDSVRNFIQEVMSNTRGQKELSTRGFGSQGAAKDTDGIL